MNRLTPLRPPSLRSPIRRAPLLIPLLAPLLPGCRQPRIAPLNSDSVVLAFGDSLTAGTGAEPAQSYPTRLAARLGCRVINAGEAGELSDQGLARLPGLLAAHRPQLVILCHGGNDLLARREPAAIRSNLEAMIRLIREQGAEVIMIGVPKPGLILRSHPLYREVADRHRVPFEGKILARILSSRSLKSDYIHPNAEGYRRMAESIEQLIRRQAR